MKNLDRLEELARKAKAYDSARDELKCVFLKGTDVLSLIASLRKAREALESIVLHPSNKIVLDTAGPQLWVEAHQTAARQALDELNREWS